MIGCATAALECHRCNGGVTTEAEMSGRTWILCVANTRLSLLTIVLHIHYTERTDYHVCHKKELNQQEKNVCRNKKCLCYIIMYIFFIVKF